MAHTPTEIEVQIIPREAPPWWKDMEFCHVRSDDNGMKYLCGLDAESFEPTCNIEYEGEAICPKCGLPTCPRCAQIDALEDALEDA